MHYLASKGFIHRDLAARNVFVTEDNICKVRSIVATAVPIKDRQNIPTLPFTTYRLETLVCLETWLMQNTIYLMVGRFQ